MSNMSTTKVLNPTKCNYITRVFSNELNGNFGFYFYNIYIYIFKIMKILLKGYMVYFNFLKKNVFLYAEKVGEKNYRSLSISAEVPLNTNLSYGNFIIIFVACKKAFS